MTGGTEASITPTAMAGFGNMTALSPDKQSKPFDKDRNGFVIAEEDLRLRGGGEVLGTRQSGLPLFRIAALPEHQVLLEAARDHARLTLSRDPELKGDDAARLRLLLYLFERDDAIKLMRAG